MPKKLLNLTQQGKKNFCLIWFVSKCRLFPAAHVTRKNKTKKLGKSLLRVFTNLSEGDETGAVRPVKVLPNILEQGPYESDVSFVKRLDRLCEKMRSESAVEAKYNLGDENLGSAEHKVSENKLLKRKARDKKRKTKKKKGKKDVDDFAELNYDFLHF